MKYRGVEYTPNKRFVHRTIKTKKNLKKISNFAVKEMKGVNT